MREIRNAVDQPLQTDIRLGLTQRQQEVLHLMSKGRSNKEIARALDIAPGTVKVHINAAFRTLGVHNRVSAAAAFMASPPAAHTLASLSACKCRSTPIVLTEPSTALPFRSYIGSVSRGRAAQKPLSPTLYHSHTP